MTEGEKLVEKVAEAMWNAAHGANYKWSDCVQNRTYELAINIQRDIARAAIAAVREHDKEKGLVHADSTGAERSSDLSAARWEFRYIVNGCHYKTRTEAIEAVGRSYAHIAYGAVLVRPTDDRSAPPSSREPDLPSSLTAPHRHMKGGIQG